jgi:hypothetical protein
MLRWHVGREKMMKCICSKMSFKAYCSEPHWVETYAREDDLVYSPKRIVFPSLLLRTLWGAGVPPSFLGALLDWLVYISGHNVTFSFFSPVQSPNKLFVTLDFQCSWDHVKFNSFIFKIIYIHYSCTYIYLHFCPVAKHGHLTIYYLKRRNFLRSVLWFQLFLIPLPSHQIH